MQKMRKFATFTILKCIVFVVPKKKENATRHVIKLSNETRDKVYQLFTPEDIEVL